MTNEELQTVVAAVIQALKTNGKTIDQLTPVTSLANSDSLEVSGGKKIAFSKLKELVASAVVVTEESIKSWVVIESIDALPEEPTTEEQMKAYVLADKSTLYVYVGEGGDTLNGSYQSVIMKGADGKTGPKGDSGVSLGEVVLVNDLTTGGEGNALSAEMGKVLNETVILDSIDISFSISKYLNTSGVEASWYDGKCTDFYACNLGDAFAFTGAGSQSRVCAYDANKDFIKMLKSSGGTNITITINDSTIKYVRASGNVSDNTKSFAKINYKSIGHLRNDIDALNTELKDTIDEDLTEGYVDGYFINHDGFIRPNSSFAYKEFEVRAGAVINFTGAMHTNLAAIAKKLTSNSFEELVPATAQSVQSFTYTATEDMTIAVSFGKGSGNSITIVTQNIESNRLNIENLLNAQSQLNQMFNTPDYGLLFDKVAVIGDSLTVGTLDAVSGDDAHAAGGSFGCSWLTCLAKKWGSRIRMHYGMGGSTCYSWLGSNGFGLGLMLKDTIIYDVYFIAYGHNDNGIFTIGTTSDTPTPVTIDENNDVAMETEAANTTFLGNYKKIVNEIRIKAPNALIFMLCTDKKDSSSSGSIGYMNQYIKELAEWYYAQGDHRVFYVDYINSYVSKSGDSTGGHWSTFGYVNIALAINHALNKVIEEYMNTNALKAWGNYLESYRKTKIDQTR